MISGAVIFTLLMWRARSDIALLDEANRRRNQRAMTGRAPAEPQPVTST
jgi:hypothetical protein